MLLQVIHRIKLQSLPLSDLTMVLHTTLLLLIVVASFSARMASANWGTSHGSSSSQYIHSNDTFTLQLSATHPNILHGPPDSYIDLNFILHNKGYERNYFALRYVGIIL